MYKLWNEYITFPEFKELKYIKGIEYKTVHDAVKGEYQFSLGAAIIKYKDVIHCSWANSWRGENDNNTIIAEKTSHNSGNTFENYRRVSIKEQGFGRSHGVYFSHRGNLYVFCPKASFDANQYPDLKTEAYILNKNGVYDCIGIVSDENFWPMCEPIALENGTIIMAGLKTTGWIPKGYGLPAVALCDGNDLTKWTVKVIPDRDNLNFWGETTILKQEDRLLAIVRNGNKHKGAFVSESFDNGLTWSNLTESNFPIAESKLYAGRLSNGKQYIVFNMHNRGFRDTLALAVGDTTFDSIYIIRDGFDSKPKFSGSGNEWCYPYAFEDASENKLLVAYSKNKEDCELAIIPIQNL